TPRSCGSGCGPCRSPLQVSAMKLSFVPGALPPSPCDGSKPERGQPKPPPPSSGTDRSALALRGDLVERRVGNLVGPNLRRSVNDGRQGLQHCWISVAAIRLRVLLPVPQADGNGVLAVGGEERELVGEPVLFPKPGQDVRLDRLGKLTAGIGLRMHGNLSRVHMHPPWV